MVLKQFGDRKQQTPPLEPVQNTDPLGLIVTPPAVEKIVDKPGQYLWYTIADFGLGLHFVDKHKVLMIVVPTVCSTKNKIQH
jgi:hypothetical protein